MSLHPSHCENESKHTGEYWVVRKKNYLRESITKLGCLDQFSMIPIHLSKMK